MAGKASAGFASRGPRLMSEMHGSALWLTYRIPVLLAILSSAGLVAALVGDGLFDTAGWICLLLPLLVAAKCFARGRG